MPIEFNEIQIFNSKHQIIMNGEVTPIHKIQLGHEFMLKGMKGTYRATHELVEDRRSSDIFILAKNLG